MGDAVANWVVPVLAASTYMALALHAVTSRIGEQETLREGFQIAQLLMLSLAAIAAVSIALAVRSL